ncbi:hypothetical protein RFI_05465, partial [Reticulomyxa filosa]
IDDLLEKCIHNEKHYIRTTPFLILKKLKIKIVISFLSRKMTGKYIILVSCECSIILFMEFVNGRENLLKKKNLKKKGQTSKKKNISGYIYRYERTLSNWANFLGKGWYNENIDDNGHEAASVDYTLVDGKYLSVIYSRQTDDKKSNQKRKYLSNISDFVGEYLSQLRYSLYSDNEAGIDNDDSGEISPSVWNNIIITLLFYLFNLFNVFI